MPTRLRGPAGQTIEVPDGESIGHYIDRGFEVLTAGDEYGALKTEARSPVDRGLLGSVNAAATGLLSGATLGLSDVALASLATQNEREQIVADRAANPIVTGAANIAGALVPALASPTSLLGMAPSGVLGRASAAGMAAGIEAGGAAGLGRAAAAAATEGALQNAGAYLSDTALGDRELTAEGMFGALGAGGVFGVVGGGAALGIERGTMAARRMFSRAAGSERAALEAEQAWQMAHQSAFEAHDAAAGAARQQLAAARTAREQAQVAKQRADLRVVETGQAGPQLDAERLRIQVENEMRAAMDPPPISPAKQASLASALSDADAARQELDDLLRSIDAPGIEPGVASRVTVPRGEFDTLSQQGPLAQGTPVQVTTVGKRTAEGTPTGFETTAFDSKDLGLVFDPKKRVYHDPSRVGREAAQYAPSEPATGVLQRPDASEQATGLEGIVRAQREAGSDAVIPEYKSLSSELDRIGQDYVESTVPSREIAARGYFEPPGGAVDPVRVQKAQNAIKEGQREPIKLNVTPDGRIIVDDGRHRLAAAIEQDAPIKVKWSTAKAPSDDMVQRGGAKTPETAMPPARIVEFGDEGEEVLEGLASADSRFQRISWDEYSALKSDYKAKLTPEERAAVMEYSGESSYGMNKRLRQDLVPIRHQGDLEAIDRAIAKSPLPRPAQVYRGLEGEGAAKLWGGLRPGDRFTDRAWGSSSADIGMARRGEITLAIDVPEGYPAAAIPTRNGLENELLLRRDTTYEVVSINKVMVKELDDKLPHEHIVAHVRVIPTKGPRPVRFLQESEMKAAQAIGDVVEIQRAAPAADDLLSALRGTESKLASGEQLGQIGLESPARADYVSSKLAKRAEEAAYFRAKHTKPSGIEGLIDAQRIASGEVAADDFFASLTRPKTRDAYVAQNIGRAMREEGSHAAALTKVEREWADLAAAGAHLGDIADPRVAMHPLGVQKLEQQLDEAVERAATATDPAAAAQAEREVAAISEQLTAVGKRPGAVEDVAAVAEAVTKYERAAAQLTEELGDAAPLPAQEAAKAFRAAEDAAETKAMARTTRAIDDAAESSAPPPTKRRGTVSSLEDLERLLGPTPLPPTSAEALAAAKTDALSADTALKRARLTETEARMASRTARERAATYRTDAEKLRPGKPEPSGPSALGQIAVGVGVAGELGIPGIPKPSQIPVIGPLLKVYLGYRALKAASGRFAGRIPASGDSKMAALAAKTKDKIATAVDKTLGLVETGARKGRPAFVPAAVVLGHRIFDDGEPDAKKGASEREMAAVRIREIANASTRPDLVKQFIARELRNVVDPDLHAAAEAHLLRRFEYLSRVMPKAPPPNPFSKREWLPSSAATSDLAQRLAVVHDPVTAFDNPTPAKVDALRGTSPKLLQLAQERLIERMGDTKNPVPYKQRLRASALYDVQLDDSLDPQTISILQEQHVLSRPAPAPQPASPPTSSIAADTNLTQMYQTGMDRRAAR